MKFSQATEGFLLFKEAAGLSHRTLTLYRQHLTRAATHLGDPPLERMTTADIQRHLAWLRTDYRPQRLTGDDAPLSSQSVRNAWTALKSFWAWVSLTLDMPDIMAGGKVPRPKATNAERTPLTQDEVKALLASIQPRRAARARSGYYYLRDLRDKAVILLLLDTGIRSGELCAATIGDLHLKSGQLQVTGKGAKHRRVFLGQNSRAAVWQYLQERPDGGDPAAPLFVGNTGRALGLSWLRKHLHQLGERVGIDDCHPHRFRYTFAIQYLRNGGDVFTLQTLLGHSSLKMVRYYLQVAQSDVEAAHRRASPVDRWLK